NR
ncbi:autotransporter beta-domain protein, partial [Chlamydia psittaci 84-8471/1]